MGEEQKRQMTKEVTAAIVRTSNAAPASVTIIIRDLPRTNIAKAGV
jgi:4-oxalocrotonate tautomerase family enzyme